MAVNFGGFQGNGAAGASAVGSFAQNVFDARDKLGVTGGFGASGNQAAGCLVSAASLNGSGAGLAHKRLALFFPPREWHGRRLKSTAGGYFATTFAPLSAAVSWRLGGRMKMRKLTGFSGLPAERI